MKARMTFHLVASGIAAAILAPQLAWGDQKPKDWSPTIDPDRFASSVDNPYFPLPSGRVWLYEGVTKSGTESLRIEVMPGTKPILGVPTTIVVETASENGEVVEIAENWFAQDEEGNVWYFGEFTTDYVNGVPAGNEGSWEAGVSDARPGIIMRAHPAPGDTYFQEFAPGVAEDMAKVIATDRFETVPYGPLSNVLVTKEWTALSASSVEHKSYAPGVGLVLEEKGGFRLELVDVR